MVMVYVPGGTFLMGADESDPDAGADELPQHPVTLDDFWIDRTEVNNAQFAAYLNEHGNTAERGAQAVVLDKGYCQIRHEDGAYRVGGAVQHPVVMVTWYGADAYCKSVGGRLPTEAEWEYAARGPEGRAYPWGDAMPDCDRARYGDCARAPVQIGSLPEGASWCGALDMAGNVWEWVADWFGDYPAAPQENPTGPPSGRLPVQRGGGWHSPWWEVRATYRQHDTARTSYNG
jgi:formylglycine-generating enzyme required for sulfatase activity